MWLKTLLKNGNEQDSHGNNTIRKPERANEVIHSTDGQEQVHYLLLQKCISIIYQPINTWIHALMMYARFTQFLVWSV